jgi:hypothetical protein
MADRQLIADLLSALEYHTEQTRPIEFSKIAIQTAREYLQEPPQRTWLGLTDDEIDNINYTSAHMLAREVEAKLREKNGGE